MYTATPSPQPQHDRNPQLKHRRRPPRPRTKPAAVDCITITVARAPPPTRSCNRAPAAIAQSTTRSTSKSRLTPPVACTHSSARRSATSCSPTREPATPRTSPRCSTWYAATSTLGRPRGPTRPPSAHPRRRVLRHRPHRPPPPHRRLPSTVKALAQTLTSAGELQRDLQREMTYDGRRAAQAEGNRRGRRHRQRPLLLLRRNLHRRPRPPAPRRAIRTAVADLLPDHILEARQGRPSQGRHRAAGRPRHARQGRRPPARRRPTTPNRPRSTTARLNGAARATPCASTPRHLAPPIPGPLTTAHHRPPRVRQARQRPPGHHTLPPGPDLSNGRTRS